jgi:hypothetical protein
VHFVPCSGFYIGDLVVFEKHKNQILMKTTCDATIMQLLRGNVSEMDYNYQKLEIFETLSDKFAERLPKKWQPIGANILARSGAFRNWVLCIIEANNKHLVDVFTKPKFPKCHLEGWYQFQLFFIEEDKMFPPKIVLQLAVREWWEREKNKQRVSALVTPI